MPTTTQNPTDKELQRAYISTQGSNKSCALKKRFPFEGRHIDFLRTLASKGVNLVGADDVVLDYPDNPDWTTQEWYEKVLSLNFQCNCGCGKPVNLRKDNRYRGIPKYLRGHQGRGKSFSKERCEKISKALKGEKRSEEFKEKKRQIMLETWKDPEYRKEQSRRMTEWNADPVRREECRQRMGKWVEDHPEHIEKLKIINKEWAHQNPKKKIEAARKGHMALAKNGKKSSIEISLQKALEKENIKFEEQWEHDLGVADFKIGNLILFADGDYWHGPDFPNQQKKDKKHNAHLRQKGYHVIRLWEHEINKNLEGCIRRIKKAISNPPTTDHPTA